MITFLENGFLVFFFFFFLSMTFWTNSSKAKRSFSLFKRTLLLLVVYPSPFKKINKAAKLLINTSVNISGKKKIKYVYFPGGSCDFSFVPFASVTHVQRELFWLG